VVFTVYTGLTEGDGVPACKHPDMVRFQTCRSSLRLGADVSQQVIWITNLVCQAGTYLPSYRLSPSLGYLK